MTVPTHARAAPQRGEEKAMQLTLVVGKSRQGDVEEITRAW